MCEDRHIINVSVYSVWYCETVLNMASHLVSLIYSAESLRFYTKVRFCSYSLCTHFLVSVIHGFLEPVLSVEWNVQNSYPWFKHSMFPLLQLCSVL